MAAEFQGGAEKERRKAQIFRGLQHGTSIVIQRKKKKRNILEKYNRLQ
jgi:predicted glycosyltransferase